MLRKKNKYISMSRRRILLGPQLESQCRLPAANLAVKYGENPQKTIHIRSDQSYLEVPCNSTDIHTLFSQLQLKMMLKRQRAPFFLPFFTQMPKCTT